MVSHFSANQYEDAFNPKKLRNWTVPRKYKPHPSTFDGFSEIIANDRGHLLKGIPKSTENPWGTFMGTWDMPCKIPPARPSYTARSCEAATNLYSVKHSSPLNNAVNGYKKFRKAKTAQQKSPFERPRTPTPPPSENAIEPSAGAALKSPRQKSPVPQAGRSSPKGVKFPGHSPTPQRINTPTPARTPSRGSAKSNSPRPASKLYQHQAPDGSVHSHCTV